MSKFEQIGVDRQLAATSRGAAEKCFEMSCKICCVRGIAISCERCAIACAHDMMLGVFKDIDAYNASKVLPSPTLEATERSV